MSSFIEALNHWGGQALNVAWPILWQSSLLIVLVFALDLLFVRKIRASVRYALWLAVLVKLLLPPALALPSSAAWWLFPAHHSPAAPATKYVVTYDQSPLNTELVPQIVPIKITPKLNRAGWVLLGSATASAGLLLWLGFRWWQVARLVRSAVDSGQFSVLVDEARYMSGLRGAVRLKLVEGQMSPAVCGLFRPVILLPRALAEKLSPTQLRAVLLHEMVHLRRFDVWVNCAQALLQIIYWWHPLLWVANARIRRVREEAVDDVVMLVLRDEADGYAPTLLEVAKLALHRPLVSLGLVGIMESRSALRQRIERLIDFRAPRKAGLTLASVCGIFVFSTVALPMGQAPVANNDADLAELAATSPSALQSLTLKVDPNIFIRNLETQGSNSLFVTTGDYTDALMYVLHSEGVDCVPPSGVKFNTQTGEITTQNTPEQLEIFRQVIGQLNRPDGLFDSRMVAFHRTGVLIEARFFWMQSADLAKLTANLNFNHGRNGLSPDWTVGAGQFNDLEQRIKSLGVEPFMRPRVQTAHGLPGQFFCGDIYRGIKTNGVEFDCCPLVIPGGIQLAYKAEMVGLPAGSDQQLAGTTHFKLRGMDATEDHGGMILRADDPDGSSSNLVVVLSVQVVTNASHYVQLLGPITGRNTITEAEPPQIHIKARFVEVPKGATADMDKILAMTNSTGGKLEGILNPANMAVAWQFLRYRSGFEVLAEPEVTMTSGRQAQMRATTIISVVTNFAFLEEGTNRSISAQTGQVDTGPFLDVVPQLMADGYTLNIKMTPSVTDFLGYDKSTNTTPAFNRAGDKINLPVALPRFSVQETSTEVNVLDHQTVVFVLAPSANSAFAGLAGIPDPKSMIAGLTDDGLGGSGRSPKGQDKQILVFVTTTLVDSVGDRLHSDDELAALSGRVVPQPIQ